MISMCFHTRVFGGPREFVLCLCAFSSVRTQTGHDGQRSLYIHINRILSYYYLSTYFFERLERVLSFEHPKHDLSFEHPEHVLQNMKDRAGAGAPQPPSEPSGRSRLASIGVFDYWNCSLKQI